MELKRVESLRSWDAPPQFLILFSVPGKSSIAQICSTAQVDSSMAEVPRPMLALPENTCTTHSDELAPGGLVLGRCGNPDEQQRQANSKTATGQERHASVRALRPIGNR